MRLEQLQAENTRLRAAVKSARLEEAKKCAEIADQLVGALNMMQDVQYRNGAMMVAVSLRNRVKENEREHREGDVALHEG